MILRRTNNFLYGLRFLRQLTEPKSFFCHLFTMDTTGCSKKNGKTDNAMHGTISTDPVLVMWSVNVFFVFFGLFEALKLIFYHRLLFIIHLSLQNISYRLLKHTVG